MSLIKSDFVYRSGDALVVSKARGSTLYSTDGRPFIDLQASSGACVFGYRSDLLVRSMEALSILPSKPQFCESLNRLQLARRLRDLICQTTGRAGHLAFDLGGAQGIEHALKLVSATKPASNTVLVFEGAYHGRSLATSHLSASPRYRTTTGAGEFNVVRLPVPDLRAQAFGISATEAAELCRAEIDALFSDERYGLANGKMPLHSLVFEPILNVAGMIPLERDYLRHVIAKARDRGAHIIADEIFTGFHKAGSFLASEPYFQDIDIAVFSKGLTNGLAPLAAVWTSESSGLCEHVQPGMHSSTYINSEVAIAIALATLDVRDQFSSEQLGRPGAVLRRLFDAVRDVDVAMDRDLYHNVGRIRIRDPMVFGRINALLRDGGGCGVLTASTGLAPNTLIFHPAFTIDDHEVSLAEEQMVEAFRNGVPAA